MIRQMFDWFKNRKAKNETNAQRVIDMLARAIEEVHPKRFIVPEDAAIWIMPRLVTINRLLGKAEELRFTPFRFDEWVNQISFYDGRGAGGQLGTAVAHDEVVLPLVLAAMHVNHNPARRAEVREMAEKLVEYINSVAEPRR